MVRTAEYARDICPGTPWERQTKVEAEKALGLYYGLRTATQEQEALRRANETYLPQQCNLEGMND
ncbi:hypothetical protein ABBQ38_013714 [Trebouxia sp. C0009 RCD-2024]